MQEVMNREDGAQRCDNALKIFPSMQSLDERTRSEQEEKGIFVF